MRSRLVRPAITGAVASSLLLICFAVIGTDSGFTGSVKNPANALGTGTAFVTAQQNSTTLCSSAPAGTVVSGAGSFECSGSLMPDSLAAASSTKATTLSNAGTQKFASSMLRVNSCSPEIFANDGATGNPLIARNGIAWAQAGPTQLTGSGSLGFNGTDTQGNGIVSSTAPQTYSVAVWFKTATPQGAIFGWTNTGYPNSTGAYDRMLFFDSSGGLTFGSNPGSQQKATTTTNYADNVWHLAVIAATGGATSKLELYVDNSLVATKSFTPSTSGQSGENNSGYWRVGRAFPTSGGWGGNKDFFNGNISNFITFNSALSAANVSTLWSQTTQSGYISAARSLGIVNIWDLIEDSTATVANGSTLTLPAANNPCAQLNITVASSTECVYPAQATCPAVGSSSTIAALVSAGAKSLTPPSAGSSTTLTVSTAQASNWSATSNDGVLLRTDVTLSTKQFNQTFHWTR